MSNHDVISSEQALDDYFCALLDEDTELEELDEEFDLLAQELASSEPEPEPEPELQLQPIQDEPFSFRDNNTPELEAPNLEDVERLLSQLESTNVVDELDIEEILAQNTMAIAQQAKPSLAEVSQSVEMTEEIQEWVTEVPVIEIDQPEIILAQPELEQVIEPEPELTVASESNANSALPNSWETTQRNEDFQVLYFDVNEVMFAVALDELGGIHRITELNHLIGKPNWYLGLQTNREQKFDVVDTAKWVMSDKLCGEEYKDNYQYVVMLGESMWGLASNQLMGTETLNVDNVRWREKAGKRPWLAGMVKEKMCALIHVQALIDMLNAGLDVKSMN
ncbi:chemotaxis protein CheW [Vibrio natriegens]|uniref:chemotaxis protein CheW n=1 Tax=Vibrio natriegens TaxID=691 RepID=UPI0021E73CAC|nr:chemotaxis protein CheW [Vibrio natriegens]UYI46306.1 chemotaxis protein CheW [Vibrio natriegens]